MLRERERERRYTTNGLARAAGCTRKALRVYQSHGLIPRPQKSRRACYDNRTVDRLKLILTLRQLDLPIERIGALLMLRDSKQGGAQAASPLADELRRIVSSITDRIEAFARLRDELTITRETLASCSTCENPPQQCEACATTRPLDPLSRALLVPAPVVEDAAAQVEA